MHDHHVHMCMDLCWLARTKFDVNVKWSDREIFQSLSLGDVWEDGDMTTVFVYLMDHKKTVIPDSWIDTMVRFRHELMEATSSDASLVDHYNDIVSMQ